MSRSATFWFTALSSAKRIRNDDVAGLPTSGTGSPAPAQVALHRKYVFPALTSNWRMTP